MSFKQQGTLHLTDCAKVCEATVNAWSSLVEGDEQLDQPNSQTTTMEFCHA